MNSLRADGKYKQGQSAHLGVQDRVHIPANLTTTNSSPKVFITGDLRLRVTESYAAHRPVKGHYHLELEGIEEPLHVIWIAEGDVLNHSVHGIDVAFDVRGTPAGETLTRLLTVQVTEHNGQGCIIHSSVFVQIFVVRNDHSSSAPVLANVSL